MKGEWRCWDDDDKNRSQMELGWFGDDNWEVQSLPYHSCLVQPLLAWSYFVERFCYSFTTIA